MLDRPSYLMQVRSNFPRWCLRVFIILLIIDGIITYWAVVTPLVRLIYLWVICWGIFTGLLYLRRLLRARKSARIVTMIAAVLLLLWVVVARRPPDQHSLRARYLARLQAFEQTRFSWGGETHFGVDCSGLARTALWEAMLLEGIREGNPRLLGPALWTFWWKDMSANAMGGGVYGYTHRIGKAPRLTDADISILEPGDLAVVEGGGHVLIYLGGNRWIEANPNDERVVINAAKTDSPRGYFACPVTFVRWWLLDDPSRDVENM